MEITGAFGIQNWWKRICIERYVGEKMVNPFMPVFIKNLFCQYISVTV
jgi:hypothetical protein